MNNNPIDAISRLEAKVQLLAELADKKSMQINAMIENLKKLDGYALGSKETTDKVEEHVKKQLGEIDVFVAEQKITKEVANLVRVALNSTLAQAKAVSKDAEKLFFSKQGEIVFTRQEIEQHIALKEAYKNNIRELQKASTETEVSKEVEPVVESQKQERIRPDKNPNTKVGRTAMRVVETRKKAKESSQMAEEKTSKKKGKKPKA